MLQQHRTGGLCQLTGRGQAQPLDTLEQLHGPRRMQTHRASAFPYLPPGPGAGAEREPPRQNPQGPDMLAGLPTAAHGQGSHAPQHRETQPAGSFASAEAPIRRPEEKPARGWAPA